MSPQIGEPCLGPLISYSTKHPGPTKCRSRSQTLSQNYRRLGLTSKLNARAGGTEPCLNSQRPLQPDSLSIATREQASKTLIPGTVRIIRDTMTGAIIRVAPSSPSPENLNPLNDPLNDFDSDGDGFSKNEEQEKERSSKIGIVAQLEAAARAGGAKKRPRIQSQREEEWIERLVTRWGDDLKGMVKDRRLNPQQQSEGDLRRRILKWRERRREKGLTCLKN